jgi:hypothetical protein
MSAVGKRYSAAFTTVTVLVVLGMLLFGCGSDGSSDSLSEIDLSSQTLAKCLKSHGAQFATEESDLDFFDEDSASMFATYLDKPTKLFVQIWQDSEDPREWLLWQAQPFDEEKTPMEIVDSPSAKSYVAYIVRPSDDQRQLLGACTD